MQIRRESKRIVFLIGSMRRGGAERVISILANIYAQEGWKVDILTLLDDSNDYELDDNVKVIPICNKGKSRVKQIPKWIHTIRRYVIEKKPDRIVSFIARINIITILSCVGLKKSIVISERNDPKKDGRSIIVRLSTFLLYPLADCVVFQTKWAQSCFPKIIQKNSIIISNPIDIKAIAINSTKKIVAVGRLLEQKNHTMLISAFKKVYNNYPNYKLYIYGEGKLKDTLTKQIQDLELSEAVFLPGNISDIHEKIADAEMFVLSSNYEGLSNALIEAMMMGLPCISTNCAGSNEVITNNYNGLLIDVGNEEQLFNSICDLINNKEKAYRIGENGKKSVQYMKTDNIILKWQATINNSNEN